MPTVKPRFAVTCEPDTHEVIQRLADLQGRSRGAVVAELLDEVAPALARTVALLEAAAAAPQQVKDGLRAVVEGVHDDLIEVAGDSVCQMDMLLQALREGANPHIVTRGSGSGLPRGSSSLKPTENPSSSGLTGCTCIITKHERQENPLCPMHGGRAYARKGR